jgi:dihydrolipoamide dehydrogenase
MTAIEVDVAIIGAGSAGLSARREVEIRGKRYVMIERGPHGTTCARVGCMPSKLLIAAADAMHHVGEAGRFGIEVPAGVHVDGRAVMKRVREERDRFAGFVVDAVDALPDGIVLTGHATFTGPNTLRVGDTHEVTFGTAIVATGSSPWIPPTLEAVRDRVLVNDDVFSWEDLPASVAVVGTGVIGLELGQALHRLGVRTTFFNPFDELGPMSDPQVVAVTHEVFGATLDLQIGRDATFEPAPGGATTVRWVDDDGEPQSQTYSAVVCAAGRRPNLRGLGLEALGITLDHRGMPTFDAETMQIEDSPIFIAGDVNNDRPLLHEAADEGRIAGVNASLYPNVLAHRRRAGLAVAFTDPQLAVVGARYADLDPDAIAIGEVSYADQGRARVMGRNAGLVRIYADKTTRTLVGAEMFGPDVEHTAHLLAWMVQLAVPVERILHLPFYHPVVEEGIRTALRRLAATLRVEHAPCASGLDCGPGA